MTRPLRLLLAAVAVLALGWAIAPRSALPLYDGVGFPDEPYRFVQPPTGAPATKPPTTARGSAPVHGGRAGTLTASSAEQAPQVSVNIPAGKLRIPGSAAKVTLAAAPARPLPAPRGGYLWSDVYDITATPPARLAAGYPQATITLRAATAQRPVPRIAYYATGRWTLLPTFATGRDIYAAELPRLASYAVIGTAPIDVSLLPGRRSSSGGGWIGVVVGIGALAAVVGLFLLGRRRRAKAAASSDEGVAL